MDEREIRQKYYYPDETPKVTIILVLINVLLYVIEVNIVKTGLFKLDIWQDLGMGWKMDWKTEWYKVFTAMFTHGSLAHLGSNMIALYGAGMYLEEKLGSLRFFIYYIISGLLGECLGMVFGRFVFESYYLSVGASGAIFGLFGILIVLSLRKQMFRIPFIRLVLFLALCIGDALTEENIDIWGHAGGFLAGMVIGSIYSFTAGKKAEEE
ncbi:MAG: rhomboid family intramembrane serine protease [Lachnospiraceae bacterium]|nr:rhomboid family intramembrane serine protease [Lachnospiraceae bacterium]